MIHGYCRNGNLDQAFVFFKNAIEAKKDAQSVNRPPSTFPNKKTYGTLFSACADASPPRAEQAQELLEKMQPPSSRKYSEQSALMVPPYLASENVFAALLTVSTTQNI
jgi:pentatricopeptide repeat protein